MPLDRTRRLRVTCAVALTCAVAFPAAARADDAPALPTAPGAKSAWTARIVTPVDATSKPGEGRSLQYLERKAPYWGGPNVMLVLGAKRVDDVDYLKVLLKRMPAGSAGWIPAENVKLARTTRRVVVDLSSRTVTIRDSGRALVRARAVIGAPSTPTPVGLFAVDAPVNQPASAHLGRRILAIAAYSRALARYQGGIPQTAFHAYEQLGAPLGAAASHGCVRVAQKTLNALLRLAPRGTPVLIRR
jgi:lipoprotein-anchoring transpeptidase ErfK/SrfK